MHSDPRAPRVRRRPWTRLSLPTSLLALTGLVLTPPVSGQEPGTVDTIPAGVQGAPNPGRDDRRFLTGDDLLEEAFPRSIPIPGSDVRFRIGGFVRLDMIQDFENVGDRFAFELSTIPVEGTPARAFGGRTTLHAKQSRLNFDLRSVGLWRGRSEYPLQAFVEIDFFGDRGASPMQPRLRHAYGVVGNFMAGQTWTTSGDMDAVPGTVDFSGGDALYGGRLAQIRYQDRIGRRLLWAVGLEDPVISIVNPTGLAGEARPQLPNLGAKIRWTSSGGSHFHLGGDLFQVKWQGGDTGPQDASVGFGLNPTFRILTGDDGNDALVGGGSFGVGGAHRVVTLSWEPNDAVITPEGLDPISFWQAYVGYSLYLSKSVNGGISTAWAGLENSEFQSDDAIQRNGSVHLTFLWFPAPLASVGGEVMWGQRMNKDGASGDAWRLNFMVKYKFN